MCDDMDKLDKLLDAAFVQNKLLAKNGICKFGMLCTEDGDIVVAYLEGEFNVKRLDLSHKKDGYIELKSDPPPCAQFPYQ